MAILARANAIWSERGFYQGIEATIEDSHAALTELATMHIFERRQSNGLIIRVCGRLDRHTAVQFEEELDRRI